MQIIESVEDSIQTLNEVTCEGFSEMQKLSLESLSF